NQLFGNFVERVIPRNRDKRSAPDAFVADKPQRLRQPLRVILAFGVRGDFGADHALRVGLPLGAADSADADAIEPLDRQRTAAWTIMRADAVGDIERQVRAPARG